jgi:hypothetical protein
MYEQLNPPTVFLSGEECRSNAASKSSLPKAEFQ